MGTGGRWRFKHNRVVPMLAFAIARGIGNRQIFCGTKFVTCTDTRMPLCAHARSNVRASAIHRHGRLRNDVKRSGNTGCTAPIFVGRWFVRPFRNRLAVARLRVWKGEGDEPETCSFS